MRKYRNFLLVFFTASVIVALLVFSRRYEFKLLLEMSSATSSDAQLFYNVGRGFNEVDSQRREVDTSRVGAFQTLVFDLPDENIWEFRFDPLSSAGQAVIRNIRVTYNEHILWRIPVERIKSFNEIAGLELQNGNLVVVTTPHAQDPSLVFNLEAKIPLRRFTFLRNLRLFAVSLLAVFLFSLVLTDQRFGPAASVIDKAGESLSADIRHASTRLTSEFLPVDVYAIGVYIACAAIFLLSVALDLNGSSIGMFSRGYGRGVIERTYVGAPRATRADEWGYVTPDILNQIFRANPFETKSSELGRHSVALTGNIPVRHFSTIFRPQFWAFFVLRADYAFAFYWQFKILILITGVFTWLLLITRSTFWALTGSLWYFFSAGTQWCFSWPSALPEMIGSICWAMVLISYLSIERNRAALIASAVFAALCLINFALCAYPPHLVPLLYLALFFLVGWCLCKRKTIFVREAASTRAWAAAITVLLVSAAGVWVYFDLHQAIAAIAATIYPGRRILHGASISPWLLASHFLQWTETELRFPPAIGNMSEGSGFLWLAPVTLLVVPKLRLASMQKYIFVSLWALSFVLLVWLLFPVPAVIGKYLLLDHTAGARMLPALGLANIALVCLCAANLTQHKIALNSGGRWWPKPAFVAACTVAGLLLLLVLTNREFTHFFKWKHLVFASLVGGLPAAFLLLRYKWLLALGLVVPNALAFGAVNPIQRGLGVITSSELFRLVSQRPELKRGKWLVFSNTPVLSGFVAATGCDVYTGTHYLPDIDHFSLFAANRLDLQLLNRLGYLDANPRVSSEPMRLELPAPIIVQWDVNPADPILRQIGIKYFAFDKQPQDEIVAGLLPLADKPLDGFWLYRLP